MQKRLFLFLIAGLLAFGLQAQDRHFSQFYASPINLNPALTGAFPGTYRVAANYRDQWRSVFDNPIVTISTAADTRFKFKHNKINRDAFGFGLLFFSDKVSAVDFSTTQIALSAAYHKSLDLQSKQFLSLGIQGGIAQRNVNYEKLTFQDQFNGLDGYQGNTLENLPPNNFAFGDLNVGLNYSVEVKKGISIFAGGSMHHVFSPIISFYHDKEDSNTSDERLFRKYSLQLSAQLSLSDKISLIPRVLYSQQGPHLRLNAGSNIRIGLNNHSSNALQLGAWARPVKTASNPLEVDAIVILAGIELGGVLIGFSYDASINDISIYRQGQNSLEFSVSYIGNFENENILCPSF